MGSKGVVLPAGKLIFTLGSYTPENQAVTHEPRTRCSGEAHRHPDDALSRCMAWGGAWLARVLRQ